MQLIQIGEARAMTILQMIEETANRQFEEIELLKRSANERRAVRTAAGKRAHRCNPPSSASEHQSAF